MMKSVSQIFLVALLLSRVLIPAQAVTTTPTILPYEGLLKSPGGVAITTAQDFRFSLWSDSDYDAPADFDGLGDIPGGASGFSGYEEVQTVTPDTTGFFQISIGSVNPIPDFIISDHLYLQVEIKPNGSPNTSYEVLDVDGVANTNDRQAIGTVPYASNADYLDNAEIGTGAGDIPVLGIGGVFSESFIPGGTDQNTFILDSDDTGGNVTLQFGSALSQTLTYDSVNTEFDLSDDLNISGTLISTGITATGTVNFSGASQTRIRESDFTPVPDCASLNELVFDTTDLMLKYCTVVGSPGTWVSIDTVGAGQDLDGVYDTDVDKTLAVDNASGLTFNSSTAGNVLFNLQNTGDLVVQDNGTTFALFSDTGLFQLQGLENTERLRLSDTTNGDSIGMYVGVGTPDGVINAQSGSVYFDEDGALYVNNSVGGSGTTWNKTELTKAQTLTVAKSGGDYTSIKTAVESINDASALKPYTVNVYPGVYVEDDFTLPNFVSLVGAGAGATIVAADPTDTLITAGTSTRIDSLVLSGASGVGGVCYRSSTTSLITNVQFTNCETGLLATSGSALVSAINVGAVSGTFTNFISAESGAKLNATTIGIRTPGAVTNGLRIVGSGTQADISTYAVLTNSVVDGAYVDSGATLNLLNGTIRNTVNGVHVGPTGASTLRGTGSIIENSSQYTLYVESGSTDIYMDAIQTNKEKFNVHPGASFSITFNNVTENEEGSNVFGKFSVGSPENPNNAFIGSGDPYTNGMLVYTFDGITYTDVTDDAANPVGTPFSFPGTSTGNSIYLSTTRNNGIKFGAYQYLTSSTGATLGAGEIAHEYWNGSSWVSFQKFCYHATLYYRYDGECFLRPDSDEILNLNASINATWVANDPIGLGDDYYWIRLRIASDITTAPVFEQFKIVADSTKITSDGTLIFHGNARNRRTFINDPEQIFFGVGTNSPSNSSFAVGTDGFPIDRNRSVFSGSGINITEINGSFIIPKGLCTACPVTPKIYWKKMDNGAGDVKWHVHYFVVGAQNVHTADGANIPSAPRALGEDVTGLNVGHFMTAPEGDGNTANQIVRSDFVGSIDVSSHVEGDMVFIHLYRDASDVEDTYNGNVMMTGFELNGVFWSLGEKL